MRNNRVKAGVESPLLRSSIVRVILAAFGLSHHPLCAEVSIHVADSLFLSASWTFS